MGGGRWKRGRGEEKGWRGCGGGVGLTSSVVLGAGAGLTAILKRAQGGERMGDLETLGG